MPNTSTDTSATNTSTNTGAADTCATDTRADASTDAGTGRLRAERLQSVGCVLQDVWRRHTVSFSQCRDPGGIRRRTVRYLD